MKRIYLIILAGLLLWQNRAYGQENPKDDAKIKPKDCCEITYKQAKKDDDPQAQEFIAALYAGQEWWTTERDFKDALKWYEKRLENPEPLSAESARNLTMIYRYGGYDADPNPVKAAYWLTEYVKHPEGKLLCPERLDADISNLDAYENAAQTEDPEAILRYVHLLYEHHLSYPIGKGWLDKVNDVETNFLRARWEIMKKERVDEATDCPLPMRLVWENYIDSGSVLARLEFAYIKREEFNEERLYELLIPVTESEVFPELGYKSWALLAQTQSGKRKFMAQKHLYQIKDQTETIPDYDFAIPILKEYKKWYNKLGTLEGLAATCEHYQINSEELSAESIRQALTGSTAQFLGLSATLKKSKNLELYGEKYLTAYLDEINTLLNKELKYIKRWEQVKELAELMHSKDYDQYLSEESQEAYRSALSQQLVKTLDKPVPIEKLAACYATLTGSEAAFLKHPEVQEKYNTVMRKLTMDQLEKVRDPKSLLLALQEFNDTPAYQKLIPDYESYFQRRFAQMVPHAPTRKLWAAYMSTSFDSLSQAEAFYQRLQNSPDSLRRPFARDLKEATLTQFYPTLDSLSDAPAWLAPESKVYYSAMLSDSIQMHCDTVTIYSLSEGKLYLDRMQQDTRLVGEDKESLRRWIKRWAVRKRYGEEPLMDRVLHLEQLLGEVDYQWLLPEGRDMVLRFKNNQPDYFTAKHPNEKKTSVYNYKVYTSKGADDFTTLIPKSADEGYIVEIFQVKDGFNVKLFHSYVSIKQGEGEYQVRIYYPKKDNYKWKPLFDSFLECSYKETEDLIEVQAEGKMTRFYTPYHDFSPEILKKKLPAKAFSAKDAIRTALHYFIFAYEPVLNK